MCAGGSSFDQLKYLRDTIKLNDGLVLVNGHISFIWLNIMFWRTFAALFLHALSLLTLQGISLKLGWLSNLAVITVREDIKDRPTEDSITAFAFIRQPFFHKAHAINEYNKKKITSKKRCGFF